MKHSQKINKISCIIPNASFPSPRILPSGVQFFRLLFSNVWASAPQHCSTHSRDMRASPAAADAQLTPGELPTRGRWVCHRPRHRPSPPKKFFLKICLLIFFCRLKRFGAINACNFFIHHLYPKNL